MHPTAAQLIGENEALKLLLHATREELSGCISDFCVMRAALKAAGFHVSIGDDGRVTATPPAAMRASVES